MQDFEAGRRQDLRRLLQKIFRDKGMLKVGYGLVMDLRAIATGLGGEGAGCVSVVDPFIDIGSLHRALFSKSTPGIAKVEGKGLAGLVEAQLSQRLIKRLQCSNWSQRPIQPEQIAYAALDAAVLLLLIDSFIAAAGPTSPAPHAGVSELPSANRNAGGSNGGATEQARSDGGGSSRTGQEGACSEAGHVVGSRGGLDGLQGADMSSATCTVEGCHSASRLAEELQSSCSISEAQHGGSDGDTSTYSLEHLLDSGRGTGQAALAGDKGSEHMARRDETGGAGQISAMEEAVQSAAAVWGSRLEVGGCPPKNKRDRNPSAKKLTIGESGEGFGEHFHFP